MDERTPFGRPREAHRSRPRPRESLFVANWVGIGSMCSVRIAPALRVGDAFRAEPVCRLPRAKALGCSIRPFHGQKPFVMLLLEEPPVSARQ
jgi:hypothetical protein